MSQMTPIAPVRLGKISAKLSRQFAHWLPPLDCAELLFREEMEEWPVAKAIPSPSSQALPAVEDEAVTIGRGMCMGHNHTAT